MPASPVICFGQQPCGIFPRRFLFAKFQTARRLQSETIDEETRLQLLTMYREVVAEIGEADTA